MDNLKQTVVFTDQKLFCITVNHFLLDDTGPVIPSYSCGVTITNKYHR